MKKITIFALFIFLLLATSKTGALAAGYWTVQGSTAMETIIFNNGKETTSFLISYNSNNGCRPEVALLKFNGSSTVLGNFVKRTSTSDNMVISIDGNSFYGKLKMTEYTNAIEAAFVVDQSTVNKFKSGKKAVVKIYDSIYEFPLKGVGSAVEEARRKCK